VQWIGPRGALALASALMFVVIALIATRSRLWHFDQSVHVDAASVEAPPQAAL